jgi:uncharacterized protein (DUF697 family)
MDLIPMKEKQDEIARIIRNHVLVSMGMGAVPIPVVDVALVTGTQLNMIHRLSEVYGKEYSESSARAWVGALAGGLAARMGAGALKLIPGLGSLLGGVSMAVMSGASTYALGQVMVTHYESGGTRYDFDPKRFTDLFNQQFEKGKSYAENLKKKKAERSGNASDDALQRLQELATMRDAGILSEEEFQRLKEVILKDY